MKFSDKNDDISKEAEDTLVEMGSSAAPDLINELKNKEIVIYLNNCTKCGFKIVDGATECPSCHIKLDSDEDPELPVV